MNRPTRREFIHASGAALVAFGTSDARVRAQSVEQFDVSEKSIRELQAAMTAGRVTSEQLVEQYLARIAAYDQAGPRLNAVISVHPSAAAMARAVDEERKSRGPRSPLHGIPVLLKDNFETRDMLQNLVTMETFSVRGGLIHHIEAAPFVTLPYGLGNGWTVGSGR